MRYALTTTCFGGSVVYFRVGGERCRRRAGEAGGGEFEFNEPISLRCGRRGAVKRWDARVSVVKVLQEIARKPARGRAKANVTSKPHFPLPVAERYPRRAIPAEFIAVFPSKHATSRKGQCLLTPKGYDHKSSMLTSDSGSYYEHYKRRAGGKAPNACKLLLSVV